MECVVVIFVITVQEPPPFVELSHCTTLPTFPVKINVPGPLTHPDREGRVPPAVTGFTVTATVAVLVHAGPLVAVPVTVYIVLADGLAVTLAPIPEEGDNVAAGVHT